jgi:hypothetical protein
MYATIFQTLINDSTQRQTVVVGLGHGVHPSVRVYTRLGAGLRGIAGAWRAIDESELPEEFRATSAQPIWGEPLTLAVTANDLIAIEQGKMPKTLLQKLVRAVKDDDKVSPQYETEKMLANELVELAKGDGRGLVKFMRRSKSPQKLKVKAQAPLKAAPVLHAAAGVALEDVQDTVAWAELGVPSKSLPSVAEYVERTLEGGVTETDLYDFARKRSEAVAIVGPAGTGKTSSARAYAAARELPFVVFECNPQVDEEVVQGTYIPTGRGTELQWRYSALATALTQPSVVLLNESNRMSARANALFLAILQERELRVSRHKNEVLEVHPECLILADSNDGYRGTQKSDQAFLDRFNIKVEFNYDEEVERTFIPSESLMELAKKLRDDAASTGAYSTPVSTRMLKNFVAQAQGLGMPFAVSSFMNNFEEDEREALSMLLNTYRHNIALQLGLAESGGDSSSEVEVDEWERALLESF